MKKVLTENAVGLVLGHDITQIIPGQFKGPRFKKGHILQKEDISILKTMGKDHIYILELKAGMLHENEAAERIARATAGLGISLSEPAEGKVSYLAEHAGMLQIDTERLQQINEIEFVVLATLHSGRLISAGQTIAGTRINPLVIAEETIQSVEAIAHHGEKLINILPLKSLRAGIVITGNEVFYGRITDRFGPILEQKLQAFGAEIIESIFVPDDPSEIKQAILKLKTAGVDLIVTGGGMSVDPDDVTPEGIRQTGAQVVKYGAPVLPGAMFMLAYLADIPIIGVPACAMFYQITIFDLILPYVFVGQKITAQDIAKMGHGGLCLHCDQCHYPTCPLGKS